MFLPRRRRIVVSTVLMPFPVLIVGVLALVDPTAPIKVLFATASIYPLMLVTTKVFDRYGFSTRAGRGFPRVWDLFKYCLPHRVRTRVYEPAHQELLEDYTLARRKYRTKWARWWLGLAFTFRTALMVADCLRALATDKGFQFILHVLPEPIKEWWTAGRH